MLHEILLSLSGQPSPIFEQSTEEGAGSKDDFPLLSPPEKALLKPISRLSRLHRLLRNHTSQISSAHPSTVCRAVSTTISTEQLGNFQRKVLEVEKAILARDSGYVGGYGIVPLSTIVGEFSPWVRRMEWLWAAAQFMLPIPGKAGGKKATTSACTGASLIDYLRRESQTGYIDVEEITTGLIKAAETAWMRQLSMFILYGHLPSLGREDFFIQERTPRGNERTEKDTEFVIRSELVPTFVSPSTATSILFIGRSLNHIRARGNFAAGEEPKASSSHLTLHGDYIRRLSSLVSPISMVNLATAISEIRLSLSQTALSQLLPLHKIMELLSLLHDFFLLGRGEFAIALVSFADQKILSRSKGTHRDNIGDGNRLDLPSLKEGEVSAVLTQTWAELYSLQNAEDPVDDELDLARKLLNLSIGKGDSSLRKGEVSESQPVPDISDISFDDLLFGTPATMSLHVQPPLDLFLAQSDMTVYSKIHSYLLGIRRAQVRLSDLWKRTSLRRVHPSPWGPPLSNRPVGRERLKSSREREKGRAAAMRPMWATGSATLFVLSELGGYLQGEVMNSSWRHFKSWLDGGRPSAHDSRPGSSTLTENREETATSDEPEHASMRPNSVPSRNQHDPETITLAHRAYLTHITQSLFLTNIPFTRTLRMLLTHVDYFVSLLNQLQIIQQNLDLETDEGVVDSLANYSQDEKRVWSELCKARVSLDNGITELNARLRDIDDSRLMEGSRGFDFGNNGTTNGGESFVKEQNDIYVPWNAAGVDRLLVKLEFGGASSELSSGTFNLGGAGFID